jgi:hypothetical protein
MIGNGRWVLGPSPDESAYRNVWSAAELQAKNVQWQLVCANVFGFQLTALPVQRILPTAGILSRYAYGSTPTLSRRVQPEVGLASRWRQELAPTIEPERVAITLHRVADAKAGEARTQNGPGLRLSQRNPADDTFLGVSNAG